MGDRIAQVNHNMLIIKNVAKVSGGESVRLYGVQHSALTSKNIRFTGMYCPTDSQAICYNPHQMGDHMGDRTAPKPPLM